MTLQKIACSDEGLANYLELTRWARDFRAPLNNAEISLNT